MSGITTLKNSKAAPHKIETITVTPEMAMALLEHNKLNRPLSQVHVSRIASQITAGKWKFNGDTIKIATNGEVLDGQHRLWAIIEAKREVETIVVNGIERDAFATIDTIRRMRSGSDAISLMGATRHRKQIASALTWLLRYQTGEMERWREPQYKIENSDIEVAYTAHPGIARAAERASNLRRLANTGIMTFLYYLFSNRDQAIAERMMDTLENPAGVGINDPFFRLRAYFTSDQHMHKDALMTIALVIKAANAAKQEKQVQILVWRSQGKMAEEFPKLAI